MMAFSTALLGMMTSTLKVSTRTTINNYGEPSFATSTTNHRARIVHKPGYVRSGEGEEVAYEHIAWVRSTGGTSITASDRVTMPDGTTPPVQRVERYADDDGPNHVKLFMGA